MEFLQFLNLDAEDPDNKNEFISYVLEVMKSLEEGNFNGSIINIIPIMRKFGTFLSAFGYDERASHIVDYAIELKNAILKKNSETNDNGDYPPGLYHDCVAKNQKLFDKITETYISIVTDANVKNNYSEFNNFYCPNLANIRTAIELIEEAKALVEADTNLPTRPKNQIIKNLDRIISNLKNSRTNWAFHFGGIKEAIIILGALVTIAGPNYNLQNLIDAKGKLEESSIAIEQTCINQNFINYVHEENQTLLITGNNIVIDDPEGSQ